MTLVKCKNLSKAYGSKVALAEVNLAIPRGKIVGLLGRNGAGKTTLIKLLNGLLTPTSGTVRVNDQPIGVETKKIISYLPERTYLNKYMRVREVLQFFSDFYEDFDRQKAEELITKLELDLDSKVVNMSKGMQEKLQLALVMSRSAELYILDEPLGGVDPATRDYILDTFLANFSERASMLVSTHLISDIERILDEVIIMNKGKIVMAGDADELRCKEDASIDEIFRRRFKNV